MDFGVGSNDGRETSRSRVYGGTAVEIPAWTQCVFLESVPAGV